MQDSERASTFSGQVLVLFGTQIFAAGVGIINGILLARLLGPAGKGDYYLLTLLPGTAVVLVQLGLPQAFGFFAARGQTLGIVRQSMVLTAILSAATFVGLIVLLPLLQKALLGEIAVPQVLFVFLAFPLALNATFTTGIVTGRQAVRWYAAVNAVYPIATTGLLVIVLGGFGPSINGALAVYLITTAIQSIGLAIGARRAAAANSQATPASNRELLRYGLVYYPASLTSFFSLRVDAYLIAFLTLDAAASLGYYSMAVGLAEMVFIFPKAVWTMFFPHVAGAPREDSDRQVAMVVRVTLLVTSACALLLIPPVAIMIWVVLPAFIPSFPPFLVLLPGVTVLGAAGVLSGYMRGIGSPGIVSAVNMVTLAANVGANLILIPAFGIGGAAAASLFSYSLTALLLTAISARAAGRSLAEFWIIRGSDIRFAVDISMGLLRRALNQSPWAPGRPRG